MSKQKKQGIRNINHNAAGIDIGSRSHFVAIPSGEVREFSAFTCSLKMIASWLKESGVETVAMESTGTYWVPLFELLDSEGLDVNLVDARQAKNMPGRKSDVMDCQWLQELHSFGLLTSAFRPKDEICKLRALVRQKTNLTRSSSREIQHIQKALDQMNIKLRKVLSSVTSVTGLKIIRDIIAGERDPNKLAKHKTKRSRCTDEDMVSSLDGNYREEHIFVLEQSLAIYDAYQEKIKDCEAKIQTVVDELIKTPSDQNEESKESNLKDDLKELAGVDLTQVPGISELTTTIILSELGPDLEKFKSEKHFSSWLGLCPGSKISGGKVLGSVSKKLDILVVGDSKPTKKKIDQALKLKIKIVYEKEWNEILNS